MARRGLVLLLALLVGCGADVVREDGGEDDADPVEVDRPFTACGGALTGTPRVLATGLATGELHLAGDRIIVAEHQSSRVLSIDRCTGETSVLAELGAGAFVGFHGHHVAVVRSDVVAAVGTETGAQLLRVPLEGGEVSVVVDLASPPSLVAHAAQLSALVDLTDDGAGGEADLMGVFTVDVEAGTLTEISRFPKAYGGTTSLGGGSAAGVYVSSQAHGSDASLLLVPIDGGEPSRLDDTRGVSGVAVGGERLLVASILGEDDLARRSVLRMALAGGEAEVLLEPSEVQIGDLVDLVADRDTLCWSSPYARAAAIRCMRAAVGADVLVVDERGHDGSRGMVLAPDALYWLRGDAETVELIAAAVP